jgi:hypothetical protein
MHVRAGIAWQRLWPRRFGLLACALLLLAVILRLLLLANGWPRQSSEEGTFGVEALHIAYRGQFPIFMYGQDYMGTIEAYVAAVLFHIFGVSWFTLRLSMVLLFALFLSCLYFLAKLLYSPKLALVTLALLCFGSFDMLLPEMMVLGGAIETLCFGTLLLLLATHLALNSGQALTPGKRWLRFAGFAAWGCCAGLGLWSHLLVAPFVLVSGLFLLFFCRKEILSLAPVTLLIGLCVGLLPYIIYNIQAPPGHDTLSTFFHIYNMGASTSHSGLYFLIKQCVGTIFFSLPTITGMNALYDPRPLPLPYFSSTRAPILHILAEGGWSLGYLLLLALALSMAGWGLWQLRKQHAGKSSAWSSKERQMVVIYSAQLMLLFSAVLTIALFVHSADSASRPWSTRYMIGLLVATPALLWPLWNGINSHLPRFSPPLQTSSVASFLRRCVLFALICLFAAEMSYTTIQMPSITADNAQANALTRDLEQMKITHIYSGYWQCDRLIFLAQEKLICAVVNSDMSAGLTRYQPYYTTVHADPQAAYVFSQTDTTYQQNFEQKIDGHPGVYRKLVLDGYVVYILDH